MAAEIDFQPYLQSISTHYEQWWRLYTLTDAETKAQQQKEPQPWKTPFDFGLMVQTVQRDRSLGSDGSDFEAQSPKEKIERFPVLEGIRKFVKEHRQVLLVGRPGSGKSTTLARLLLEEARGCSAIDQSSNPLLGGARGGLVSGAIDRPTPPYGHPSEEGIGDRTCIPVLVELRFLSNSTLLDRIQAFFQRHDLQLDRTQIEDLLFHRRLLLLMDGLNELPSEAVRLDVAKFRQDYPKVSMIFTTRDLSLGGDFGLEKKLEMQPLTEAQMQDFVRSYVPEQAEAMLRQLKDRLREFGQTPLLLWMLCGLFRQTGEIPANLGEVFRAFTQGYEKNLKADVPVESDRRWWPELLQELAFAMMHSQPVGANGVRPLVDVDFRVAIPKIEVHQIFAKFLQGKEAEREGSAQRSLDDLLRHHLIQENGEQVEFRHQLLQEYYAAEYLLGHWEQLSELEFKRDYLNYLKWTEAIRLMVGRIDNENLVLKVVELSLNVDLMLGAKLAGKAKGELQSATVSRVSNLELPKWLKFKLLKEIGTSKKIPKLLADNNDEDFEANWNNFGARWMYVNSLGILADSEESISSYLAILEDYNSDNRVVAALILGQKVSEKAIPGLIKAFEDQDSDVRWAAAVSLVGPFKHVARVHCLPQLKALILHPSGQAAFKAMSIIQFRCGFYNYDLTQSTPSMKLFFSYAHKDETLRDELAKHLSLLKRQNIITDWHDRNITAGTDWAQAIDNNLNTANIILLLISSDFLASDYCYDKEMTRALELHNQGIACVMPIILRPCDWHSAPFGKLQALPKDAKPVTTWDNPDEAFTHIAQGIRKAVAELQQRKTSPATPQPKTASSQPANVTMNFYGTVHGAAGTVQGDQNIQPTE
ncbi:TIR domain-containing protein [Altericista sp. CCNU0014]|uniref:TIR domain-containing protein n=1 Tax=Altericista sp. CCNU0014 TaxID=3082949 RepID=UPI00384F3AD8